MANVAASGTLTANTAATVTLNEARGSIKVVNVTGTTGIYFTVGSGGVTPATATVGGTDCYVVPAAAGAFEEVLVGQAPVVVSIISAGASQYTVECDHPSRH